MNKDIMKAAGFNKEVKLVNNGYCPFCESEFDPLSFRDELSLKEYLISGICQTCQDKIFDPTYIDELDEEE